MVPRPAKERFTAAEYLAMEWVFEVIEGMDATLGLTSVDCSIPLAEIYSKVSWLS